ncbi:MAG: EAL domain-containing protein [Proteobacteria bacterium]|nr:EAL domain-containing protein [Pseudomonadota bacterium]
MHKAFHDAQAWRSGSFPDVRISVNLSGRQLADADLPDLLRKELDLSGIDPDAVDLEITENTLMTDNAFINEQVARVHRLGMHLAIYDYGTGYASIGYLRRFPVRTIKVDRVFMHDAVTNPSNAALADAIIAMARSLNLQVVAEGIENRQQVEFLRHRNCRFAQGFLYGEPRPLDGFIERLKGHASALTA